jgi:hypothetical protein
MLFPAFLRSGRLFIRSPHNQSKDAGEARSKSLLLQSMRNLQA